MTTQTATPTVEAPPARATELESEPEIYLTRCASCGGQFPTFRDICSECEDVAEADGYREGKKVIFRQDEATSADAA